MVKQLVDRLFYRLGKDFERQMAEIGDFRGFILNNVTPIDPILEVGPGYMPLLTRSAGFNVKTIDHTDQAGLIEKYTQMGVDASRIETVDYIWRGEPLPALVGGDRFKYIIASHMIEHSTDMVGFLSGCAEILHDDGAVILIVPDKRYCFDYFQPLTDSAKVLADAVRKPSVHSIESLYRQEMQVTAVQDGARIIAWWQKPITGLDFMHTDPAKRYQEVVAANRAGEYVDAHEYHFSPTSFHLICEEMRFIGLLPLELTLLTRSHGCEFLAVLRKPVSPRLSNSEFTDLKKELALRTLQEQLEAYDLQIAHPLAPA